MSVAREGQSGKGHMERTEAVRLKKACVGVGQRRLQLNLADRNWDRVHTATSRTSPWTSEKSNENHTKSIKNVPSIVTKSLWDGEGGQNRSWTAFGTMLWTPKMRLCRSKSGLGMPRGCQKRLENASGCAKDIQKRAWRAPETHSEPICLGERRPKRS